MANWGKVLLTEKGKVLHAKVLAKKLRLEVTDVWASDKASGASKTKELQVTGMSQQGTTAVIQAVLDNKDVEDGFMLQSMGIYAKDENGQVILFSYIDDDEPDTLPAFSGSLVRMVFDFAVGYSNAEHIDINVTVEVGVTHKEFDEGLAKKQDKLTAGTGIEITNNVINVDGEIIGDSELGLNGYIEIGEILDQWGYIDVNIMEGNINIYFPKPFTQAFNAQATYAILTGADNAQDSMMHIKELTNTRMVINKQNAGSQAVQKVARCYWRVIGKK